MGIYTHCIVDDIFRILHAPLKNKKQCSFKLTVGHIRLNRFWLVQGLDLYLLPLIAYLKLSISLSLSSLPLSFL